MHLVKKTMLRIVTMVVLFLTSCEHHPFSVEALDPLQIIITETNLDSLILSVKGLSGEQSVNIEGASYTINSRHKDDPGNDLAADYIEQNLERYGLEVVNQHFSETGRNIYAVQWGSRTRDEAYIICAHYDSYSTTGTATGADDNASGTATVLEAARLLSNYNTDYSIVYAFWDEEEQGLRGSSYYAAQAKISHENILGVINIDMIGWDSDTQETVLIDTDDGLNSLKLYDKVKDTNDHYQIGLAVQETNGLGRSDHASFWRNGFGAILIIEHFGSDWNPFYHTPEDRMDHFNLSYFHKCARLAIGTLAALAETRITARKRGFTISAQ
ncbi:MAG: M28 family metallopeptidase [bacterium]